jgi:hypothetical protein
MEELRMTQKEKLASGFVNRHRADGKLERNDAPCYFWQPKRLILDRDLSFQILEKSVLWFL